MFAVGTNGFRRWHTTILHCTGKEEGVLAYRDITSMVCRQRTCTLEICGLLSYYTASCGNYLPTFRDNISVPSSRVKISVRMGQIRCPETSVNNYHTTPCNNPEDHRFHQHCGGSLKSTLVLLSPYMQVLNITYHKVIITAVCDMWLEKFW
jgi:hypothetical protein